MHANNFTPNNNSASEVNQAKIIIRLFHKANQKFAETIKERVG
jgi:hypothetical protein